MPQEQLPRILEPENPGFVSDRDWSRHGFVRNQHNRWIPERAARQAANVDLNAAGLANPLADAELEIRRQAFIRWRNEFIRNQQAAMDPAAQIAVAHEENPDWVAKPNFTAYFDTETSSLDNSKMKTTKKKEKKVPKPVEYTEEQKAAAKVRISVFGQIFPESTPDQWTEYDGAGWSHISESDRFHDCFKQCYYSHKWQAVNQLGRTVDGFPICREEVKKRGWIKCQHSDYWVDPEKAIEAYQGAKKVRVANRYLESGDYFQCGISNKFYSRHSRIQVRNSARFSWVAKEEVARTDLVRKCEICVNFFDSENVTERNFGAERPRVMSCTPCFNRETSRNLIRAHNFAEYPAPIHKAISFWRGDGPWTKRSYKQVEDAGIRLFGVEVETEMSQKACKKAGVDRLVLAREVKETLGNDFVMIKEDGSLSLNGHYADGRTGSLYAGFEIVSAPADIEVHRQRWSLLEKMKHFDVLRAWNTETCGLHVHVSKDALTTLQIGRILMLITHNNNKKFIAKVAGRGENKYCKAYHKEKFSDGIQYGEAEVRNGVEYIQASFHLPRSDEARRQAVNITNPRTIEFRIFRGTVHPRHIIRNIEFADAVCSFCHPGSRSLKELTDWHNLVHYIAENRKTYPLLTQWMETPEIGLLPYRSNAYGPKDTRGTKRPEVVEAILSAPDKEELAPDDPFGVAGLPIDRPVLRMGELRPLVVDQNGFVRHEIDPAAVAAREARRARRAERRVAAAALAALNVPVPAQAEADEDDDPPPPLFEEDEDNDPGPPW